MLLMEQLTIHEDTKGLRTESGQKMRQNMFDNNLMLLGIAHRKFVAVNSRIKFVGLGEMGEGRQRAPFGDNFIVRHNAEATGKRIAVDLDARWLLAGNVDGEVHAKRSIWVQQ
jgi:hypothetical protein